MYDFQEQEEKQVSEAARVRSFYQQTEQVSQESPVNAALGRLERSIAAHQDALKTLFSMVESAMSHGDKDVGPNHIGYSPLGTSEIVTNIESKSQCIEGMTACIHDAMSRLEL